MANTTYMELTNQLLNQFNEVEVQQSDWTSIKGVQRKAARSVNNSLRMIYSYERLWPFTATSGSQVMTAGTQLYNWPADFRLADMASFQIQEDSAIGALDQSLRPIDKDEWYTRYRDFDGDTDGRDTPRYVFQYVGNQFGVTPNPNKAFTLNYNYYKKFVPLSAYDDETDVPPEYDHVILNGGMFYFNLAMDNNEQAQIVNEQLFKPSLKYMRSMLINDEINVIDTRIKF